MPSDLVINVGPGETRVALLENGTVVELYIERAGERSIAGNIYKGRVARVLPGMQAAFVDIGLDKAAFLYVSDVYDSVEEEMAEIVTGSGEELPVRTLPKQR
jgi:ribonuclease G